MNTMHSPANVIKTAKRSAIRLLVARRCDEDAAAMVVNAIVSAFISEARTCWKSFVNNTTRTANSATLVCTEGLRFLRSLYAQDVDRRRYQEKSAEVLLVPNDVLRVLCLGVVSAWSPTQDLRVWISVLLRQELLMLFQPLRHVETPQPPFKRVRLWPQVKHKSRFVTFDSDQLHSFERSLVVSLAPQGSFLWFCQCCLCSHLVVCAQAPTEAINHFKHVSLRDFLLLALSWSIDLMKQALT